MWSEINHYVDHRHRQILRPDSHCTPDAPRLGTLRLSPALIIRSQATSAPRSLGNTDGSFADSSTVHILTQSSNYKIPINFRIRSNVHRLNPAHLKMNDTVFVLEFKPPRFRPSRNGQSFDYLRSGLTEAQVVFERELNLLETPPNPIWNYAYGRPWTGPHALQGNRASSMYPEPGYLATKNPRDTCWWAGSWRVLGVKAGRAWALKRNLRMVVKGNSLCERRRRREDGYEGWDWERGTLRHTSSSNQKEMMFW